MPSTLRVRVQVYVGKIDGALHILRIFSAERRQLALYYGCDMGYKMAENDLRCHSANKTAIVNLREQIKSLEDDRVRIRSATTDATPVTGGAPKRSDWLDSNIFACDKLRDALKSAEASVARVSRALDLLDDEERLLLDRFYINRQKDCVERLMAELGLERAAVYKHKDAAFRHFLHAMYSAKM